MQEVRVGLGIIIIRDKKVLIGKRRGSHAEGLYSFPGGHLDFGETWDQCALREVEEECGPNLRIVPTLDYFVTNDIMPQYNKHYITIFMVTHWQEGEAENYEPEKCDGWQWVTFGELKSFATAEWIPIDILEANRQKLGF